MELKQLRLVNFCQHTNFTFNYQSGITGVMGDNGAGKSNFVDVGQFFAVTGKVSNGVKSGLLRWGAKSGHTELVFTHGGHEYTLTRNLHNSKVELTNEKTSVEGAEANQLVEDILGMTAEIFYETCFVPQGKLWDVITMTHSNRMAYFQRIADAKRAETLRGMLVAELAKMPNILDRTEEIKELKQRQKELTTELEQLTDTESELAEVEKKFAVTMKDVGAILSLPTEIEYEAELTRTEISLKEALKEKEDFLSRNYLAEVAEVLPPSDELEVKRQQVEQRKRLNTEYEELKNAHVNVQLKLEQLKKVTFKSISEMSDKLSNLQKQIEDARKIQILITKGVCPTCGSTYSGELNETAAAEELEKLTVEKKALAEEEDKLAHEIANHDKEVNKCNTILEGNISRLAAFYEQLAALEDIQFDITAYVEQKIAAKAYNDYCTRLSELDNEISILDKQIAVAKERLQRAQETTYISKEKQAAATECKANYLEIQGKLHELETNKAVLETNLKNTVEQLELFEKEQAERDKTSKHRTLFEQARDRLHREQLPKLVMSNLLTNLNYLLMEYLSHFSLPFTIEIDDDFDFMAYFPEANEPKPACSALSGGQKVAVSIAFHLALTNLLAGSIPLLVLDEPTNHLNASSKERIQVVLSKIRQIADREAVFLISTHDSVLVPAMTRVIELKSDN